MQVRVRGLGSLTRRATPRRGAAPRRAAGPEMAMGRWPMAALLSSVALIARRRRDVICDEPA